MTFPNSSIFCQCKRKPCGIREDGDKREEITKTQLPDGTFISHFGQVGTCDGKYYQSR